MILLALTVQAASADPVRPTDATSDIVVLGAKLSRFRASAVFDENGAHCRIAASTGDGDIDEVGCRAIEACYPTYTLQTDATRDRILSHGRRKDLQRSAQAALDACFASTTKSGLAELGARRAAAGAPS